MPATSDNPRKHEGRVGQGFLDPMDEWQAECSCGWHLPELLPYVAALAAAQAHVHRENGSEVAR